MTVIGYYYFDSKDREILHVPMVFVLIEPPIDQTEVILEPKRLKSRFRGLQRVIANEIRDVQELEIHENDVQRVIRLCSSNKKATAKKYCEKIFNWVLDQLAERYQGDYDPKLGFDTD